MNRPWPLAVGLTPDSPPARIPWEDRCPIKDSAGRSIGALIVFEAEDEASARAEMESDPYTGAGVYAHYELAPVAKAFPKR